MKKSDAILIVLIVAACCYLSHGAAPTATAGFINPPYNPSRCFDEADNRTLIVHVGKSLWNDGANCGRTMTVVCLGPVNPEVTRACKIGLINVDVLVVDTCEDCESDILYLSKEAFGHIAYEDAGLVEVAYYHWTGW